MLPNISTATVHRWGTGHKRCPARARRTNVPPYTSQNARRADRFEGWIERGSLCCECSVGAATRSEFEPLLGTVTTLAHPPFVGIDTRCQRLPHQQRRVGKIPTPPPTPPGDCLVILGGWGQDSGLPRILADPSTHQIRKFFLRGKMKFIKGAREWKAVSGTQTFLWPQTPRPPVQFRPATKQSPHTPAHATWC